jgi:hypothetical protein
VDDIRRDHGVKLDHIVRTLDQLIDRGLGGATR